MRNCARWGCDIDGAAVTGDHVVFDGETRLLQCTWCGETYPVALPVRIPVFVAVSKAFLREHRDCEPKVQP